MKIVIIKLKAYVKVGFIYLNLLNKNYIIWKKKIEISKKLADDIIFGVAKISIISACYCTSQIYNISKHDALEYVKQLEKERMKIK